MRLRRKYRRLRELVLVTYGGKCRCCGEPRPEFLQLDHVFNDGAEHRRLLKMKTGGYSFYKWIQSQGFPQDRYQLLCANCNYAKSRYGQCPHVLEKLKISSNEAGVSVS